MEEFRAKQPKAWAFVNTNRKTPELAMRLVATMITFYQKVGYTIKWLANPAAYDWQWLNAYYQWYAPEGSPKLTYSAKCTGSMWTMKMQQRGLAHLEDEWEEKLMKELERPGHMAHNPQYDALVQGRFFFECIIGDRIPKGESLSKQLPTEFVEGGIPDGPYFEQE